MPTAPPPPSRARVPIPSSDSNPFVATESSVQDVHPEENPASHGLEPVGEPWYVGTMSRKEAERLLRYEGDFLVRASAQHPGQFVLSGLQDNKCRHLLLADPKGQVRTKERVFGSIQHLIDYHVQNGVPIRSGDSEIRLIFPVSAQNLFEF
ncbi:SH2 domain protein, partial [Opisthorchis viverrini]